jgi:hypothetical protein
MSTCNAVLPPHQTGHRPAGLESIHNGHRTGRPQLFKIGCSLPGSHEADLPVELYLGAQPGDIARALGGVLPGDRVDVVLNDRAAYHVIAKTWAENPPSLPFLARALDYDSRDPGMCRLLDDMYLSAGNPNAPYTLKTIDALRSWRHEVGDLSWFTSSATEFIRDGASTAGAPNMSWRQTENEIEIEFEINDGAISSSAVVVIFMDSRVSIAGPLTLIEEDGVCHSSVTWSLDDAVERIDLVVQRTSRGVVSRR